MSNIHVRMSYATQGRIQNMWLGEGDQLTLPIM